MAANKAVKVSANYAVSDDSVCLWGVDFVKSGAKGKERYTAEVDGATAKSLIDADRASLVK